MSAPSARPRRLVGVALATLFGLTTLLTPLAAAPLPPPEPSLQLRTLLPGRLAFGATALPGGEILAPCEDLSLSVLDASARVVAVWNAPARFGGPVTASPRGPVQFLAAPLISGRVEVLAWDAPTGVLAPAFAAVHAGPALSSAWGVSGTVFLGWSDGRVEAWSVQGGARWAAETGTAVSWLLSDEAVGVYAFGQDRCTLLDSRGRVESTWAYRGRPRGVLQTQGGDLVCWTETGVWIKGVQAPGFQVVLASDAVLGAAADVQDRLVIAEPGRLLRLGADGTVYARGALGSPAVTAPVLDGQGRILLGTAAGLELRTYDGRVLAVLGQAVPAAAPLITDDGRAVWSGADWGLQVWTGLPRPAFGWFEDGGGPGRSFSARRPSSVAVRALGWTDDPTFNYFFELAASGDEDKQRQVLDRFQAKAAAGNLVQDWPFAPLVLLKIARSGLTDLHVERNRVTNSWPANRLRALRLLSASASPEDRDELLALLKVEYDPAVAAQGAEALVRSTWDGDGSLMRMLAQLQGRMADQAVVADAVIEAARALWAANGRATDPILVPLVSAVYQGPYPRAVKQKAQQLLQDFMLAP